MDKQYKIWKNWAEWVNLSREMTSQRKSNINSIMVATSDYYTFDGKSRLCIQRFSSFVENIHKIDCICWIFVYLHKIIIILVYNS